MSPEDFYNHFTKKVRLDYMHRIVKAVIDDFPLTAECNISDYHIRWDRLNGLLTIYDIDEIVAVPIASVKIQYSKEKYEQGTTFFKWSIEPNNIVMTKLKLMI